MNSRSSPFPLLLFLLFAVPSLLLVCLPIPLACTSPGQVQQPARAWVDASRAVHDVVAPRFRAYVQADPALDVTTRDVLLRTVEDWEFLIRTGEASIPPAPAPAGGGS